MNYNFVDYRFPYLDDDYVAVSLNDRRQRNLLKLFVKICDDPKLVRELERRIRRLDELAKLKSENNQIDYLNSKNGNNTENDEEFDDE